MVKSSRRRVTKDTKSQKRRKKKMRHFGFMPPKGITEQWDNRKTLAQNYKEMGLLTDVNAIGKPKKEEKGGGGKAEAGEHGEEKVGYMIPILKEIEEAPAPAPYVPKSMGLPEQRILDRLMRKHGEDYEAMARDIKVNVHQQTVAQLKKRIALFKMLRSL